MARFLAVLGEYRQAPDVVRTRLYYEMYDTVFGTADGTDLVDKNLKNFLPLKSLGAGELATVPAPAAPAAPAAQGGSAVNPMRKTVLILVLVGVVLLIASLLGPYYIVMEGEQAVVVQFGKIVRVERDAGLKYKVPFVESVVKYSKKIESWDGDAQRIPTSENQFIWVDTTARWRIVDPKKFYESVGSMTQAQGRLDDVIDSEVRKIISRNPLSEAVRDSNVISQIKRSNVLESVAGAAESSGALSNISTLAQVQYTDIAKGRRELSIEMLDEARTIMPQYGMELVDVIIRQIKYSDELTQSVYDRMIKERNQIAQAFRSDGEGEKARWLGQTTRELKQIQSDATRKAKEIMATADGNALAIRNKAYSQDPGFADYWMALQEYQTILPKLGKTMTTDADFYKYLYSRYGR